MKITDINLYVVPMHSGAEGEGIQVGWVFVQVETDAGLVGTGECSNWPRRGNQLVANTLHTIKDTLIGRDPGHIEAIWQELYRNYTYLGSRGLITTVISGIDTALWDLKGKALGRPVYDLLGGPVREGILLYTHPGGDTPESAAENCRQLVQEGYTALKTDPFGREMGRYHTARMSGVISRHGEREGAAIVAAMRAAVGPEIEILIDAHGQYDVASAIRCAKALAPYDLTWFEEPVPPESYAALRQVREAVDVPICVGERLFTRWDFAPVLEQRLAEYLMPDVCWTGGISELKKIAALAETHYVSISPHGALGPFQLIAGAHTVRTVPNFYRLEAVSRWFPAYNQVLDAPLDVRAGVLYLSDAPGLGYGLNMDYVRSHAAQVRA
ncbi:MAG: mandelate racemase/muconate lactonizing enzyme family protein [Chloroflexota bacterium]